MTPYDNNPPIRLDALLLLAINQKGGAETSLLRLAEGMAASGLAIGIAAYGAQAALAQTLAPGCSYFPLQSNSTLAAYRPLKALLQRLKPGVVISGLRFTNLLNLFTCSSTGARCILTEHSVMELGFAQKKRGKLRLLQPFLRYAYRRADAVVAVSQGIYDSLRKMLGETDRLKLIYNPIALPNAEDFSGNPPHPWFLNEQLPCILGVGRLSAEKDFPTLIRAFATLQTFLPSRLIILGDGDERNALEALANDLGIAEKVFFAGHQEPVFPWLAAARLFVSSSCYEGFGNAIVEAMACGVPVIATDCPVGPREILSNGKYGRLVPVGDASIMAQAMRDILEFPPVTTEAAARAHDFDEAKSVVAYRRLLEEVMANPQERNNILVRLRKKLRDIIFYEHWSVGVVHEPIETCLGWPNTPSIEWIDAGGQYFYLADPFALPGVENNFLCERFDYKTSRGSLVQVELTGKTFLQKPMDVGFTSHLSFPYTFVDGDTVYCIPESGAERCIVIHERLQDGSWRRAITVLEGVAAADNVLFYLNGYYWIAYTDTGLGMHDNLNLLYAPALAGPWSPHAQNPVVRGKACSRNGGTPFFIDGILYRPAQDCSYSYGGSINIMRVENCTPTHFRETLARRLAPITPQSKDGFHTLSAWGNKCLVDGKQLRFSAKALTKKALKKLHLL